MRCSRLIYLVCVNLLVLLLLVLAATPLVLYPTSNDNDASTTLLSTFLVTQALTLTVALYRPTKDSRTKTQIIAFCLAQILLFAVASTGVSVALSLSLYEDSDVPWIEVAGGTIFTLGSLSLILSSIVDVDVVDDGGEDVAASKNATTMSLSSPTDGDSITEPLLQQTANPTATKTTATSSTPPKNPTTRLLSLAIPHRAYLYAGCIALLIRLPFSLSIPHFVSEALGSLSRSEFDTAYHNIILLFVAGTVDACLDFWCVYLFGLAQLNLVKTVRTSLFSRLLSFEVNFFDQNPVGNLTSRLNSDTSAMSSDLTWFFRFSIEATVRITGIVTYMFIRSPVLAGAACCVIPLVAIVNKKYGDWLSKNSKKVQTALAEANSVAHEALSCVRTVIAFGSEEQERKHYNELIEVYYRLNVKQTIAQGVYYMVISTFLVNTVVQAILLYVGSRLVKEKGMEVDVLLAFMLYQGQLQEYTLQIFQSYTALLQSSGAGDKVFELMDRKILEPGVGSEEHGREEDENTTETLITTESPASKIEFMEVSFKYPTRPEEQVLSNLNLTIESGQTVAIVGQSGCGKSTIVSLLARFYDVDSGTIRFNDRDIRQVSLKTLRSRIGIISQEPTLFSGSIFDNIVYGLRDEEGDDDEIRRRVEEAAKTANAHDFICSFAKKYDTLCGERGVALSGGQKQRIAIARAIVKRPQLLLCDEATAALDNESEQIVQQALDRVSKSTTTIVVAHRLRTVRNADKIVVVKGGEIVEAGDHDGLLRRDGKYSAMVKNFS